MFDFAIAIKKNKKLKNVLLKNKDKKRAIAAVVFLIFNIYTVFDESKNKYEGIFNIKKNKKIKKNKNK